jgi:hypothetical protein
LSVTGTATGPTLSSAVVKGKFQLTFSGGSNQTYRVLAGTNLLQPMASWVVLTNGTFGGSPVILHECGVARIPVPILPHCDAVKRPGRRNNALEKSRQVRGTRPMARVLSGIFIFWFYLALP